MNPQNANPDELNRLVEALYGDLHRIAERHMKSERPDHTLQATALLHEAYMKLSDSAQRQFGGETHFLATASRVMRQVLVDHARARLTSKRGSGKRRDLEASESAPELQVAAPRKLEPVEVLELNRAIDALARDDAGLAQLVELRYFGGMTAEQMAAALNRSVHGVRYDLRLSLAWLRRELDRQPH